MITIPVGDNPRGIALNEQTNRIYVSSITDERVTVINGFTNTVIATIQLTSDSPESITVNEVTNRIYTANVNSNDVTVIDGVTNEIITTITAGGFSSPRGIVADPKTNRIFVINGGTPSFVLVIDGETNMVTDTINTAQNDTPRDTALNKKTRKLYVPHSSTDVVSVIDISTNVLIKTISSVGGSFLLRAVANEKTNKIYMTDDLGDQIFVIDGVTDTVISPSPIPVGNEPTGIAVHETTNTIYVGNGDDENLSVIEGVTDTVIPPTINSGNGASDITINETTSRIYVVNSTTGIDTVTVIGIEESPFVFRNEYSGLADGPVNNKSRVVNTICGDSGLITGDVVKELPTGSGTGFTPADSLVPRVGIATSRGEAGYGVVVGGNQKGVYGDGFRPLSIVDIGIPLGILAGVENDSVKVCTQGVCLARVINTTNTELLPSTPLTPDLGGTASIDNFGTFREAATGVITGFGNLGGTFTGYTDGEDITLSGGSGMGATATAIIIGGIIQSLTIVDGGLGFADSDTLTITGVTSSKATATIEVATVADDAVLAILLQSVPVGSFTDTRLRIATVNIKREGN